MGEIVNPYIAGAPVTEQRMFFGRDDIFQWIENSIAGQYADHILVVHGQRRVGKTSVLKQLGNRLPKRYIPVFFDLQGRTHTSLDHFLWWLAREIVRVLRQERGIESPPPDQQAFSADPEYFENQFLGGLRSALGNNTLLLTFDEFDNLEESEIKETLARPLVDHLRRLMGQPNLNFIFSIGSSGRKLENMQAAYTDFFKTALYKKISFLNEEQTHRLVTRPVEGIIEYERGAVDRIYGITSGHPYFTQLTCHELFARCQRTEQRKIAIADVEAILDDVVERGTVNLKFVWDEASDIEKWSLTALAQLDKTDNRAVSDYLRKNRVRFSESDLTSGLLHLREKDVLTPQNRFVIHLLRIWLQKNRPIEQAREELTEANPIANRFIEIGLEFRDSGQFEKAIEFFRQALSVSADNLQAQVNIALTYAAQGQLEQAITEFEKALTIDDEDVASRSGLCDAHLALGDAALQKGRPKEAVLSYQRVLAINAEHLEARGRMAELSRQRAEKALTDGKDEEALSAFAEALKFTPEDQSLIARSEKVRAEKNAKVLAEQLARSEKEAAARNWDKALAALNAALEIAPGDESILKKIQTIQEKQLRERLDGLLAKVEAAEKAGRWDTAISTLNEYLQLKPDDAAIQKRIADMVEAKHAAWLKGVMARTDQAMAAQNWDEALTALNEALRLEPDNAEMQAKAAKVSEARRIAELNAMLKRADQAAGTGRWDEAINILNDGLASDPENETLKTKLAEARKAKREAHLQAALRLADSAAQAGKWEAAVASLNEVLANEPDNAEFQQKLAEVRAREHESRWDAVQTQSESLREAEEFEQAIQAWQAYLSLYPEDRERTDKEIKQVTQEQELRDFYAKAETAITARDFDGAIRPLKEIIIRDENYKDASRLLTKAIESRRTGTTQKIDKPHKKPVPIQKVRTQGTPKTGGKRIWIIGGLLAILALGVAGVFFGPKLWNNISTGIQQTVGVTPTGTLHITDATPTIFPEVASIEPILAYISETQPDFEDDFSSDKWGALEGGDISTKNLLKDGVLNLVLEAGTNSEKLGLGGPNLQASQFALELDFYFEGSSGSSDLFVGFPSQANEINSDFHINLDKQKWAVVLDNETINGGDINENLKGQWAHLQVIYSGTQLVTFLNGKFLGSTEGVNHYGQDNWIIVTAPEGQAKVRLDNIKFWDLVTFSSASEFVKPILTYTANTPPDFEDDFSSDQWGDLAEGISTKNLLQDETLILNLEAGTNSEKLVLGGSNLQASQFALEFDFYFDGGTGSTFLGVGFPSPSTETNNDVIIYLEEQSWSIDNTIKYSGEINETLVGQWSHLQIIYSDSQVVAFLNGELLGNAEGISHLGNEIWIAAVTEGQAKLRLDNIKFWDLSGVDFSASETTSLDPAIQIALDAIHNEEPLYQTSFDTWDFGDPVDNAKVENGKLVITGGLGESTYVPLDQSGFSSDRFAVEFETQLLGPLDDAACSLNIGNNDTSFRVIFWPNGDFRVDHPKHPDDLIIGSGNFDSSISNTVTLIVLDDQFSIFFNGEMAFIRLDPEGSSVYTSGLFEASSPSTCEFDNYKIWDLSGVDFSASTGTTAITPSPTPKASATPDTKILNARILNPANQHLYLYVEQTKTWSDARDYCAEQGGYLVTIQDATENVYVYSLTEEGWAWLGATDEVNEGTWVWVSGEPWKYSKWAYQQPSGDDYLTYKAGLAGDNRWDDVVVDSRPFVCEWDSVTTTSSPETQISPKDSMVMAYVPAGEFTMGSNSGGSNEKPAHTVYLDSFWIDQTEVTNRMYALCVSAGVCQSPLGLISYSRTSYYSNSEFEDYPVLYIDWDMAKTYCNWAERHLPTEAEWEKAARGTANYTYPWGEEAGCDKVNALGCKGETSSVGEYELGKSPYGVFDMAGNVMEWVADWYSNTYYASSPRENPIGPSSGAYHVLRGGSWKSIEYSIRSSYRLGLTPDMTNLYLIGFRCALGTTP